jgi:hypothetical protein
MNRLGLRARRVSKGKERKTVKRSNREEKSNLLNFS